MEASLEFVAMSTIFRCPEVKKLRKSIKCIVLDNVGSEAAIPLLDEWVPYSTPHSSDELLSHITTMNNFRNKRAACFPFTEESGWVVFSEHFQDGNILQMKRKSSRTRSREVALILLPSGEFLHYELPSKRRACVPYESRILGRMQNLFFGVNILEENLECQMWVFDFAELLLRKVASQPHKLSELVFYRASLNKKLGWEYHFERSGLAFIWLGRVKYRWRIGIVQYSPTQETFSDAKYIKFPPKHLGFPPSDLADLDQELCFRLDFERNQLITCCWSHHLNPGPGLYFCICASKISFQEKNCKVVAHLIQRPELPWTFRAEFDDCHPSIRHFNQVHLILVEFRCNRIENFRKTPAFSVTWIYVVKNQKFTLLEIRTQARNTFSLSNCRQLCFRDSATMVRYWIGELPETYWPNKRFCIIRVAYLVD